MIAKAYLRAAAALVRSAVFVMAGGAYDESATIVLESDAQQDGEGRKTSHAGRSLRIEAVKEKIRQVPAKLTIEFGSFQ